MAISFNGSSTYIEASWAATHPMTLACWALANDTTNFYPIISVGVSGGSHRNVLAFQGTVGGDPIGAQAFGTSSQIANTSTGYSASTWTHCAATFADASNRAAFINGGSKGSNTAASGATGLNTITLGARWSSTRGLFLAGRIFDAAVWSAELTDEEIAALASGITPLHVRPQSLAFYAPLVRDIIDIKGGILSAAGTAVNAPPRTYR